MVNVIIQFVNGKHQIIEMDNVQAARKLIIAAHRHNPNRLFRIEDAFLSAILLNLNNVTFIGYSDDGSMEKALSNKPDAS